MKRIKNWSGRVTKFSNALDKIPRVVIGENKTFMGEEGLLRARGVSVEVLQDATCVLLMQDFIKNNAKLWNEDIGVSR